MATHLRELCGRSRWVVASYLLTALLSVKEPLTTVD